MSNFFKIFIVPTGDATDEQIGISESLITSAVAGVVFALCAGQPLIITGIYVLFLQSIDSALNHTYKTKDIRSKPIWVEFYVNSKKHLFSNYVVHIWERWFKL